MAQTQTSPQLTLAPSSAQVKFLEPSSAANKDLPLHRWANWIAGFSGDFVRSAIQQYLPFPRPDSLVLDPFAGVGTTLLEAYREGIDSVGFEINPYACLVCNVKLAAAKLDVASLRQSIHQYQQFFDESDGQRQPRHSPPPGFKSRIPFFSRPVERGVLYTLDFTEELPQPIRDIFRVALASVMVEFSNYTYEPSLGSRPAAGKPLVSTAPVGAIVTAKLLEIATDIEAFQMEAKGRAEQPRASIHQTSFFDCDGLLRPRSVDLVVTSPPYMNNYHYVRNTRPQLFWTWLVQSPHELKALEEANFGKFWQNVRSHAPVPLDFPLPQLERQIVEIRAVNPEKPVYGGAGWANYVATYMNDLNRLCQRLGQLLRPGGVAVIVIGNSIIQGKEVAVHSYVSDIARLHGLDTDGTSTLRSRVGSSIVNTGDRLVGQAKYALYDYAVVLRRATTA